LNNITGNTHGVRVGDSSGNNTIFGNNMRGNTVGIMLLGDNQTVFGNNIIYNTNGIGLDWSNNNTIRGNNISGNIYGVHLWWSSYNKIYHNNLIDNVQQVYFETSSYANFWDDGYPSGGNYWSDHVCIGNPSDGSQPYIIDSNNIDHYPFQDPNGWLLPKPPVGGTIVPVNKLELLIPYISVVSVILVAITVVVKKRRLNHIK